MSVPSHATFAELAKSGMPAETRSAIRRWWDSPSGPGGENKYALAKLHVQAAGNGIRAGGESLLVGGALGIAHSMLPGGLDFKKAPLDALAGGMFILGSVFGAQEEVGKDLGNAGAACLAVFGFRKMHDVTASFKDRRAGITSGGGAAGSQRIGKASFSGESTMAGESRGVKWGIGFGADIGAENDPILAMAKKL